ncbi:transcriptional regulator [Streptomyces sparsogenes DSM 40356]|uniref:Transcriptional regulator n=1 Tax=Streptomyces sparsogenes DSM 40356 TaxID=1331668 RepID=A0A1R1SB37_9ACTN|nr:transcriptional regulator [Streptomyces sparsogenes DSM 40356]
MQISARADLWAPQLSCTGPAEALLSLWVAVRANVRKILGEVTLADVATATLPDEVLVLAEDPEAWTHPWPTPLSTGP